MESRYRYRVVNVFVPCLIITTHDDADRSSTDTLHRFVISSGFCPMPRDDPWVFGVWHLRSFWPSERHQRSPKQPSIGLSGDPLPLAVVRTGRLTSEPLDFRTFVGPCRNSSPFSFWSQTCKLGETTIKVWLWKLKPSRKASSRRFRKVARFCWKSHHVFNPWAFQAFELRRFFVHVSRLYWL